MSVDVHVVSTGGDPADDLDDLLVAGEQAMEGDDQGRRSHIAIRRHRAATPLGLPGAGEGRHAAASLHAAGA